MFRVVNNITLSQQPSTAWPNRRTVINMNFCNSFEAEDSWRDLTNQGKLVIPKNLYFRDQFNKLQPLHGTNINVGGFSSSAPLILRGDKITISAGYKYFARKNADRETTNVNKVFEGYVSKVDSKIPIEVELEDNMWLLKQTPVDTQTFTPKQGLSSILKSLIDKCNSIHGTKFTFNTLTETTFGIFHIGNETACQVLQRLQKEYGFESYFRGNELRSGVIIYIESEAVTKTFEFQKDILPDHDLEYVRKDDVVLSAVARTTITTQTGKLTKDGQAKTKKNRIEVLVTLKDGKKTVREIKRGDTVPSNNEGERRTFFFPGAKTVQELADLSFEQINKYYYSGMKGSFTTFGIPFMRQGDNVKLIDNYFPERNGIYKIKKIEYSGGVSVGIRQKIHLDYKINING